MNSVNKNVELMYHNEVLGVNAKREAQYYIGLVQRVEKNVLISDSIEEKKEHYKDLEDFYTSGILENINTYRNMANPEIQKQIDNVKEQITEK